MDGSKPNEMIYSICRYLLDVRHWCRIEMGQVVDRSVCQAMMDGDD